MKRCPAVALVILVILGLICICPTPGNEAQAQAKAKAIEKITVLTPMGTPPLIKLKPMAPRLTSLEGRTIYLVNQGYLGTDNLLNEMIVWLQREYPKTTFVYKELGRAARGQTEPPLFAEIKEKADAVIMATGH